MKKSAFLFHARGCLITLLILCATYVQGGYVVRYFYDGWGPEVDANDPQGGLLRQKTGPSSLRTRDGFPGGFTRTMTLVDFLASPGTDEGRALVVTSEGEQFGEFVRGYIEAPQTGLYTFFVRGDDQVQLFLSTDHTRGKLSADPVCHEPEGGATFKPFAEDGVRSSAPIPLEKGKKYYFEVYHLEYLAWDHFAVGWRLPDGTLERPIRARSLWAFPADPQANYGEKKTAPLVILPPTSTTALEGTQATFSFTADASQPATVQWRRNGEPIPGANLSFYQTPPLTLENEGDRYDVVITNPEGTAESAPAALSVIPDTIPPVPVQALTRGNTNGVDILFSEPVGASALVKANYAIDQGVVINSVVRMDEKTIRLETSHLPEGKIYTVQVSNIQDLAQTANAIPAELSLSFAQVHGVIKRKVFQNLSGDTLSSLEPFMDGIPNVVDFLPTLETPPNVGERYGAVFQGYLTPLVSGDYLFYLASDNEGALFLSGTENPEQATRIAWEPKQAMYREYHGNTSFSVLDRYTVEGNVPSNISQPISLQAGQKYYLEIRYKQGSRGDYFDHMNVAWSRVGERPIVNGDAPVPGVHLSAYGHSFGPVRLTEPPASQTAAEFDFVTFRAVVDGAPPYGFKWFKNGQAVPGATHSSFQLDPALRINDGDQFQVVITNHFSAITSQVVTLQVLYDNIPPSVLEVTGSVGLDHIVVHFSEAVNRDSGEAVQNYSVPGLTITRAQLSADQESVILFTSPQVPGGNYLLTIRNIEDTYPLSNRMPEVTVPFESWAEAQGHLVAEYYLNIPGSSYFDLIAAQKFPERPDEIRLLTQFSIPENQDDDYGVRVSGFVVPSETAEYVFYLRSADNAVLSLSTNEFPAGLVEIARELECCRPFEDVPPRRSEPILLESGKKYFVQALVKAGVEQDFLAVAWKKSGEATPPSQLAPISGSFLSSHVPPAGSGEELRLTIQREGGSAIVSWSLGLIGATLQEKNALVSGVPWNDVSGSAGTNRVVFPAAGEKFFRLKK